MNAAEIAALLGRGGRKVTVAGRDLTLLPLNLCQVADALEVLSRLADRGASPLGRDFDPVRMLLRGGRDALELLAVACADREKYLDDAGAARAEALAFVSRLDPAEGARLFSAAYEVNRDFFLRNREQMLEALSPVISDAGALADALVLKAVGVLSRLLSSSSSQTGTSSGTSGATPSGSSAPSGKP